MPMVIQSRPVFMPAAAPGYDLYRVSVYGRNPDRYCDPTKSLADNSGNGLTEGTAWNQTQAMANATAGQIVGLLPTGSSAVAVTTTNDDNTPAWRFANNGSNGSPIIAVTKYSAIELYKALGRVATESSALRTELKHTGTQPTIVSGVGSGTGCAIVGSTGSYHEFDGLFINQATAWMKEDSGNIRDEASTNFKMRNFVVKGALHTVASNCVCWRPNLSTGTHLRNFVIYDFGNDPTGSDTPQEALGSDQYGSQAFLVEHGLIENIYRVGTDTGVGLFPKGAPGGVENYGTFQYLHIKNCDNSIRLNALHTTLTTSIRYCLMEEWHSAAIIISNEGPGCANLSIDHVSFVDSADDGNYHGPIYNKEGNRTGISITNCLFDGLSAGHSMDAGELTSNHPSMTYNVFYRAGSGFSSAYNGTDYGAAQFAAWQTAVSASNNQHVTSDPLPNRGSADYLTLSGAAATASNTGGPVGAYGSPETIGII